MARPVIALLTDFGLRDHYVASMKGVALSLCPDATFIDISHDIPPQDILAGALELEGVAPYLPDGTVVVAVVDPGVGSHRRGVAIEAGGLRLVGPDNGIFSLVASESGARRAVALANTQFRREQVSRTFEGRDRFAPAAAWLARGTALAELGPVVDDLVQLHVPEPVATSGGLDGVVLRIDHFGNLVTNLRGHLLSAIRGPLSVEVGDASIAGLSGTYSEVAHGDLCAVIGSTDRLEISVNGGSASAALGAVRGTSVRVRARSAA